MSENNEKKIMPTIEDLVEHMQKYKDAVIIIGDKVANELNLGTVKDIADERFTRKAWTKDKYNFWKYYYENIYKDLTDVELPQVYKNLHKINNKGLISSIIATNMHGLYEGAINLKGISHKLKCSRCGKDMNNKTKEDLMANERAKNSCDECLGRVRPACLLYEENYHPANIKAVTEAIFKNEEQKPNTHTLILVGVDMEEDLLAEIYDNYLLVRENTQDKCYIVMMSDNQAEIGMFTPEFATSSDIEGAFERFVNLFE